VNLAERACRRFRELAVEPRGRGAVGGVGERERGEDAVRVLARGGGDPRRVVFCTPPTPSSSTLPTLFRFIACT